MKKAMQIILSICLLAALCYAAPAKAASEGIQPYTTASFSVTLKKYSSTKMEVNLITLFGSSSESCTLDAVLQRKVNGTWTNYKYFSTSGKGYSVSLVERTIADKGYTYRVKGTLNSTTFSNIVQYSSELSW